jgi:Nucleotidyltransferase of unknown function (DUF6036)
MTSAQLEHLIRAASQISGDDELIIIGSQAVLGQYPRAPDVLLVSVEADLFPKNKPELADLIDGTIGELSPFHDTFGYYAHGVAVSTAILPRGWRDRLVALRNQNTLGATGWCLEIHDLLVSKLVAGREKDFEFAAVALREKLATPEILWDRLAETEIADPRLRTAVESRVRTVSIG